MPLYDEILSKIEDLSNEDKQRLITDIQLFLSNVDNDKDTLPQETERIHIDLKEFAATGKFGGVELGMLFEKVVEIWGEPSHVLHHAYRDYHMVIYGGVLLIFPGSQLKDSHLVNILTPHLSPNLWEKLDEEKRFNINFWIFKSKMPLEDVQTQLDAESFIYYTTKGEMSKHIYLASGLMLDFYKPTSTTQTLNPLKWYLRELIFAGKPFFEVVEDVKFFLNQRQYRQLQDYSQETGISKNQLISEWVQQSIETTITNDKDKNHFLANILHQVRDLF